MPLFVENLFRPGKNAPVSEPGVIRVGPAGWSYEDWKGPVYPSPAPAGFDPLIHLARQFSVIELNNTFYRPPTPRMTETWAKKTSSLPDFEFTAKLWQQFTHEKEGFTDRDLQTFRDGLRPLAETRKLGALLAQFPWFLQDGEPARSRIEGIVEHFRDLAPVLIEVRHATFGAPDFLEFLRRIGAGFCNIDQPKASDSLTGTEVATAPVAYLRLHGRNREAWFRKGSTRDEKYNYLYSPEELAPLADAVRRLSQKSSRLYVIFNNHYQGHAVTNALQILRMLRAQENP